MIAILKLLVGGFVVTAVALIFLTYVYTKCKNDDRNTLLSKAIGVAIGVAIMALGIWALS